MVNYLVVGKYTYLLTVSTRVYNHRGYSLIGKTAILHIVILGSIPNISKRK
jgi:hypothetical protein